MLQVSPDRALDKLLDRAGIDRVTIDVDNPAADILMDVEELTLEDASFDLVLALAVIDEVREPRRALAEVHRVLCPAGTAIFQVAVPKQPELAGELVDAGFEVETLRAADLGVGAITRHGLVPDEATFICRRSA